METDSSMTGEEKQISRCWGSLRKADIIMSLVSVKEEKETNGSMEQLCCSLSVIYVVMCVLVKDFLAADLQVLTHRGAIVLTEPPDLACAARAARLFLSR